MEFKSSHRARFSDEDLEILRYLLEEEGIEQAQPSAITPRNRQGDPPLSFGQERLWVLAQLEPDSLTYTIPFALRLVGSLDVAAFQRGLSEIVRRHEILRTTFPMVDGRPVQSIASRLTVPLSHVDLHDLPPAEREGLALQLAHEEARFCFDLAGGPLLRMTLLCLDAMSHVFLLVIHHIICDGWSIGVFMRELAALYDAFSSGQPSRLPELTIQYADFACWQRQAFQGAALEEQFIYWRHQLGDAPAMLALPTDRPRPAVYSSCGATYGFTLPPQLTAALQALSQRTGATLFMTLLAAWQVLLGRYSQQTDLAVGTPIANRARSEIAGLIGCFINTLVLRTDLSGNPCFRELLARVRDDCLAAYAHQDLPFEQLVEALQPARDLSRNPLFQVMFVLQNALMEALALPGLELQRLAIDNRTAKLDLTLTLEEVEQGLAGTVEYSTALFDSSTIVRMVGHFQTLLAGIVAQPDRSIATLPLLTDAEWQQVLFEWNATTAPYPQNQCLHQLVATQAAYTPDSVAVAFEGPTTDDIRDKETRRQGDKETKRCVTDDDGSGFSVSQLTYRELNARANRLAHHLMGLGVGPEVVVAVCVERSIELVVALLGVLKAGGAYLPLDPTYPTGRIAFMLEDSHAAVLITATDELSDKETSRQGDKEIETLLVSPSPGLLVSRTMVNLRADWPAIRRAPDQDPVVAVVPDQLAYVIYTSGSTGAPKGAMNSHRGIVNRLRWMQAAYCLRADDRVLQKTPISFDVSVWEFFWPLLNGARLILVRPGGQQDPTYLAELIAREQITTLHFVPPMLQMFLEVPELVGCRSLRQVICSGEALPVEVQQHFFARLSADLFNLYGPTEAAIDVTAWACRRETEQCSVPIGRPIANTQIYLLDRQMRPVPASVSGELYIGGVQLARGYLGRPDLTAERFVPNPFAEVSGIGYRVSGDEPSDTRYPAPDTRLYKTGDLARYRPDGTIEFLGRTDHQVKIRGNRVELGEIEAVLRQHPAVREVAVIARADDGSRPRLAAYIVPTREQGTGGRRQENVEPGTACLSPVTYHLSSTELRGFLRTHLPDYMLPAQIVILEALPLTPNGKIDRRALPAPEQIRSMPEDAFVAPRTPIECILAQIWAEVLRREPVGVHDNFFRLGGDSILSIQVVARAREAGLYLTPKQLFQHQTITELAMVTVTKTAPPIAQGSVTGPVPLTPIQQWFFEQDLPEPHHYNQSLLLAARQPLDPALLPRAVQHLLTHHDALRLCFVRAENGWHQHNAAVEMYGAGLRIDLTALPATAQSAAITAAATTLQRSLNLANGPLVRVAHFICGVDQPDRLLIIIHHLAVDGVSWRILLADLQTVYAQLSRGVTASLPPKTTAFQQWAARLHEYARSSALRQELAYWLAQHRNMTGHLPRDSAAGANTRESARTLTVALDADETRTLLQDIPAVYRTQINDVLLMALAQALTAWTGGSAALVELEGHGREELFADMDLTRTVGWYTSLFPVLLNLEGAHEPGAALKAIKEQLRAVPNRGIGYGMLRYLSADPVLMTALRAQAPAEVMFNYLGQVDQALSERSMFGPAPESCGPEQSPRGARSHLLEINGIIAGGQLHLAWTYSATVHQDATIAALAEFYLAALRSLIAHCRSHEAGGYTPSDFPLVGLDQTTLDRVLGQERQVEDLYPLAPIQQGMLFHTLYDARSGVYVSQLCCSILGELDFTAFQQAWQHVVARHPILRTSFLWENEDMAEPLQIVRQQVQLTWTADNWRGLSPHSQATRLEEYLQDDRAHGFVLSRPPLLRLALMRTAEDAHQFIWSHHHLLLDGWSMPLVLKDVFAEYTALVSGREIAIEPPRPYRDYIAWLQRQDIASAEAFWRRTLHGFSTPTPLMIERLTSEASEQEMGYVAQQAQLAAPTTAALHEFARQHGLTMNTLVQGAWAILLSRYSGKNDVVFGVTVAGRPPDLAGVERMVGLFINTVPARLFVDSATTPLAWLAQVQAQQIEVRQYEYSPLAQVQNWSDVPRGQPLFESILVFENYPVGSAVRELSGSLTIQNVRVVEQTNYPLTLVAEPGTALTLRIGYDRGRFDSAAIARMLGHLRTLLEGFAAQPDRLIADLPLLTAAEWQELVVTRNATQADYLADQCYHHLFGAQAACTPDAVALVFDGRTTDDQRPTTNGQLSALDPQPSILGPQYLTYRELQRRANQLAHELRSLGAGPGVRVGICMERSFELVVGLLGIFSAGAAFVPLDADFPIERMKFIMEDAQVRILLTQRHIYDFGFTIYDLEESQIPIVKLDADWPAIARRPTGPPPDEATSADLAYVIYTSGSTGRPKGVPVPHHGLVNYLVWCADAYTAADGYGAPVQSSITADAIFPSLFAPLIVGTCVVLLPEADALEALAAALRSQGGFSMIKITPSQLDVLNHLLPQAPAHGWVRTLVVDAEVLRGEVLGYWQTHISGSILLSEYGPAETVVGCSIYQVTRPIAGTVPIGLPIANTQFYVLDRQMRPLPIGVPGELYIGGDGMAWGYLNRPDLTAERFVPNPFSQGSGIRDQGSGRKGSGSDPRPPIPDTRLYKTGDLVRYLDERTGNIEFLGRVDDQVEMRGNRVEPGEVEAVLRQHPQVREVGDHAFVAPHTPIEELLASIWTQILGVERVGIHDNFFELGGDSILSIQITAKARQAGLQLSPRQVFDHPTIAELAPVAGTTTALQADQGPVTGHVPLTPIQHWFFEQKLSNPHHWNQALVLETPHGLDLALLDQVFRRLFTYHDALRLRFVPCSTGWQQIHADVDESFSLTKIDLSDRSESEQATAIDSIAEKLHSSLHLTTGPLLRVAFFDLGRSRPGRLLVIIHHLMIDGVSWRILLEDIQAAYRQLSRGESIRLPPKTTSFKRWAELLTEYARSARLHEEAAYWLTAPNTRICRLPLDHPTGANTEAATRTLSVTLDAEETWALLQEVPRAYRTRIDDVLLTALAQTLAQWSGVQLLLIDLEGHGREEIVEGVDLSRTVGWFTTIFPVWLDLDGCKTPGDMLTSVKEQLRALSHQGIGYGAVCYLSENTQAGAKLRALPQAEVLFNYLGQADQVLEAGGLFRSALDSYSSARDRRNNRRYLLEINSIIMGGQLRILWTYSGSFHREATIARLGQQFVTSLRTLISHCRSLKTGATTSTDFPLAGLSQEKLDAVITKFKGKKRR